MPSSVPLGQSASVSLPIAHPNDTHACILLPKSDYHVSLLLVLSGDYTGRLAWRLISSVLAGKQYACVASVNPCDKIVTRNNKSLLSGLVR